KLPLVGVESADGAKDGQAVMQDSVRYEALSDLVTFLDASAFSGVRAPGASLDSDDAAKMSVELSLFFLQMVVQVKGRVGVAASQHGHLFAEADGPAATLEVLFCARERAQCIVAESAIKVGFCKTELLNRMSAIIHSQVFEFRKIRPGWGTVRGQETGALNEEFALKQFSNLEVVVHWYNL
ncbi:unnamed protein product, partial [Prorocentrum cordatum]